MATIIRPTGPIRGVPKHVGGWLPEDPTELHKWVTKIAQTVRDSPPARSKVVQDLEDLINKDPEIYMLFNEMLSEVPSKYADPKHPNRVWPIGDVPTLLNSLDLILTTAPLWTDNDPQIGTPINALLCWPMATTAGFAVFLKTNVSLLLKNILVYWGTYLSSADSCTSLNELPGGWFSLQALESPHMLDFAKNYVCNPFLPHWGFTSWDNFFTRQFREGVRPVASPGDDSVVVSAAEAQPFSVQSNVKLVDNFWVKGQPYSLTHMLNGDARATNFVGGSVYQAFLSADSYHCWHAPVSGHIVDTELVPGTYYSEPVLYSFKPDDGPPNPDAGADEASQGYISAVAARGLIWIQADNPDIGLMCIVMVGMAEVSSVDVTMPTNTHFEKGDEIGRFHFGGSTHCLIFGPQVQLDWAFDPNNLPDDQWPVNTQLAKVSKKASRRHSYD
ncbi:hypothetical protein MMC28_007683 [Mycoblastus sanguinarius]|nr:hypothetical protein [Mycoblastus sanguinarius]